MQGSSGAWGSSTSADAGVGDPAIDFAGLCISYGEPFLRRCARAYPLIDLCWERIRFYADCAFLLEDALFCAEYDTAEAGEVIAEVNQKPRLFKFTQWSMFGSFVSNQGQLLVTDHYH